MKILIKKLNPQAQMPASGSASAAGYDLYSCLDTESLTIAGHETVMVGTGLAAAIPEGYFGGIFARSGLAAKQGLRPANCVGVVDSDYRGELKVALHNDTDSERKIENGERIAQLVVLPYLSLEFEETQNLDETERGTGGFGHTGRV
ncbi:MAG: dUTP diphosphatase [Lachnospiraceae bacterium]|nr:dUTP diphosphatase [Lachnospiraceae bacterium]